MTYWSRNLTCVDQQWPAVPNTTNEGSGSVSWCLHWTVSYVNYIQTYDRQKYTEWTRVKTCTHYSLHEIGDSSRNVSRFCYLLKLFAILKNLDNHKSNAFKTQTSAYFTPATPFARSLQTTHGRLTPSTRFLLTTTRFLLTNPGSRKPPQVLANQPLTSIYPLCRQAALWHKRFGSTRRSAWLRAILPAYL